MLVSQSQMFLSWDLADCNPSHPLPKGDRLAMSCVRPAAPRGPQAQGALLVMAAVLVVIPVVLRPGW